MAYINVAQWSPDQVTDWLKGLDDSMYNYIYSFTNNEVGGQQLLNIRPYELEQLGMYSIGHQEIVLEAVEHLRNFHYNLDKENLQFLALHVATAARSLYRQLAHHCDKSKIETQLLNDITRTIATTKPVITWLDRSPFAGHLQFNEIRKNMLRLGLEMATSAQRDRFVENPVDQIRMSAEKLAKLADYIIQDITDPMLLQPSSLNLVTLKKRESELGFDVLPSYSGIHRVIDIKYNSPAHNSGKIEDGDEIVQINYQTVVGWQYKTVILQLTESPPDVLLTLKKRPKHTKIYGQIYIQPYRLPSKKRAIATRWGENLPSPRPDLLSVPDFNCPLKLSEKATSSDTDSSCSDILTPTDTKSVEKEIRLYYRKPRTVLQRRNTICGDELSTFRKVGNVPLWHERKIGQPVDPSSPSLRDKSVSFGFGLEITARPTTCLGISTVNGKLNELTGLNSSLPEICKDLPKPLDTDRTKVDEKSKPGVSKVVRFDASMKTETYSADDKYTCNVDNTILETFEPIPYVDEEETVTACEESSAETEKKTDSSLTTNRRGRLDKSHSTPAYDNSVDDSDTPPAIEPRKEFLNTTPPAPPPRPKRQSELIPPVVPPPPPKPEKLISKPLPPPPPSPTPAPVSTPVLAASTQSPIHVPVKEYLGIEETELVTQLKPKTMTLKKKNSLIAKRRKVTLKSLGTGDIQGHLYRRHKDKRGIAFWAKLYFVMIETVLYGFRSKDAQKASCFVFLPGFTVSLAKEVHSRPFAFKVYHPSKTFYFAAESTEALNQWMDFIRQATLQDAVTSATKELYSETDSSGDESEPITPSKETLPKLPETPSPATSTKHDYFGSLKKFTKTTLPFKTSSEKKASSDIPVPTDHFRTYRRIPGGNFGLQIGTNSNMFPEHPIQSPVFNAPEAPARKLSVSSNCSAPPETTVKFAMMEPRRTVGLKDAVLDESLKFSKTSPCNFIHASNPNLVEFDFQTSKALDYSLPKINPGNSWDAHNSLQGFVTLKDLMLQKQEEEAQEMYNNRVLLGVEKKNGEAAAAGHRQEKEMYAPTNRVVGQLSKIQMRSLPKTPDYEMSFKPDDEDIKRTRTKEGLKLRDFGYEFIYGDELPTETQKLQQQHQQQRLQQQMIALTQNKQKKYSTSSVSDISEKSSRAGSFKKTKGKFDAFKTSSERLFQFKHSSNDHHDGKQSSFNPMTLPLNKKSAQIYDQGRASGSSASSIKKSHTYNNEFKDSKYEAHRKNSAPMPILSKLTFSSSKPAKEKKWLGSPRFHRAIFGRTPSITSQHDYDHEIFCPITFTKPAAVVSENHVPETIAPLPPIEKAPPPPPAAASVTPDYPNMQCPPVFEPEMYSLSDPSASISFLRKKNNQPDGGD